jgi:hypothetical protein
MHPALQKKALDWFAHGSHPLRARAKKENRPFKSSIRADALMQPAPNNPSRSTHFDKKYEPCTRARKCVPVRRLAVQMALTCMACAAALLVGRGRGA